MSQPASFTTFSSDLHLDWWVFDTKIPNLHQHELGWNFGRYALSVNEVDSHTHKRLLQDSTQDCSTFA